MKVQTRRTILCFVLLWSHTLTDAYGLSQKTTIKNKSSKPPTLNKTAKEKTDSKHNREINTNKSLSNTKQPTLVNNINVKPGDKIVSEINELQRMHRKLNEEKVSTAELGRRQQLIQHIENQIKLRQRKLAEQQQQVQQQQHYNQQPEQINHHGQAGQRLQLSPSKQMHQFFNPSVSINSDHNRSTTLQEINQGVLSNARYLGSSQNLLMGSQVLPTMGFQKQFLIPQATAQHFQQREPLQVVHTKAARDPGVQHGHLQQHILIPLSALSSGQDLHRQRMFSDKIIVVKSLPNNGAGVVEQREKTPAPTTTMATTPPTATTTTQTTSIAPTSPQTTTSGVDTETSTAMDVETMKQTLLERTLKKQSLEIRKLQLEIRALQRQEINSQPEENEDGPQPRSFPRRHMPFPFIR